MNRRETFRQAKNYCIYYGKEQLEALQQFDVVIIEPSAHLPSDVQWLRSQGTQVLAYLSIVEVPEQHSFGELLKPEDYLMIDGTQIMNPDFHTYLLDLRSKRWLGLLRHQIGQLLLHQRYDGIFLDTIGDVENNQFPKMVSDIQIDAATQFVKNLRSTFPDHLFVQNNGLEHLCVGTCPYIDGLCWENPVFDQDSTQEWNAIILKRLNTLMQHWKLQVLLLMEHHPGQTKTNLEQSLTLAKQHRFLLYHAERHYQLNVQSPFVQ